MNASKPTYLGIDLGTTYSAMAYLDRYGQPTTILNAEGELTTPSVVLIEPGGEVVVGQEAKRAAVIDPDRVAECIKRDIGDRYYRRPIAGRHISPQALSGMILRKLHQDAQAAVGPVGGAVITVPAYFNEARRQATAAAGEIAGLKVIDVLNEPTAAALAYAFHELVRQGHDTAESLRLVDEARRPQVVAVYDLGGGTLDVTVMRIEGKTLTVLATDGDVYLGGRDWDERIVRHAAEQFRTAHRLDPREDPISLQQLLSAAEEAKHALSRRMSTRLLVSHGGQSLALELTRTTFEELTSDLLYRTESRLNRVIAAAGLSWAKVDQVLTVGGSTRMPQVLALLERVTGRKPNTTLAPDEVVAHGAAIHAAIRVLQQDSHGPAAHPRAQAPALPPAPGTGTPGTSGTAPAPAVASANRSRRPVDDDAPLPLLEEESVSPLAGSSAADTGLAPLSAGEGEDDDAEAPIDLSEEDELAPAADDDQQTQAGQATRTASLDDTCVLPQPEMDDQLVTVLRAIRTTDVNAHSLGVILKRPDGARVASILIPRNTPLPTSVTRRYGTVVANQQAVTVVVVEGETEDVEECLPLGSCQVKPLPPGLPRGSTIYVTFSYDASGRLQVKAAEATSGSTAHTEIHRANSLDAQALDRIRNALARMQVR